MDRSRLAALLALCLTACGKGEDFSVTVKQSPATVAAHFGPVDLSAARPVFPGIAVHRSRPSDDEILYTIPGEGGKTSTVRFRLERLGDGRSTAIHTTVDTLPVRATIHGKEMVLSEPLVELALRRLLQQYASELGDGSLEQAHDPSVLMLMMGLAIATNPLFVARAQKLDENDEALREAFAVFEPYAGGELAGRDDLDRPMNDPDEDHIRGEMGRMAEESKQSQAQDEAAAPADDGAPADAAAGDE